MTILTPGPEARRSAHRRLLAREALASALYLALVLLAGLVAIPADRLPGDRTVVAWVFGTAVGLLLAHWLAFRLAARLTSEGGEWSRSAAEEALAQIAGGTAVAVVASAPFVLTAGRPALLASLIVLAMLPALAGAAVARLRGAHAGRTFLTAAVALVLAMAIVAVKAGLDH